MNKKITIVVLKIIYLAFFSTTLVSCNLKKTGSSPSMAIDNPSNAPTNPQPPTNLTKEQELAALVTDFKTTYNASFTFVPSFKPGSYMNSSGGSGTTTVGVCEVYSDGSKRVYMNEDWWMLSSTASLAKKVLLYHELGHCFFNRQHEVRTYADSRPYSIMYPIIDPVVAFYPANTTYYINELNNPLASGVFEGPVVFATFDDGTCLDIK